MNYTTVICTKCKQELPATAEYFQRDCTTKTGFRYHCKKCGRKPEVRIKQGQKRCRKCGEWKDATEEYFPPRKDGLLGLGAQCRECVNQRTLKWRQNNRELFRAICSRNNLKWRHKNLERVRAYDREYKRINREEINEKAKERARHLRQVDPMFRLNQSMTTHVKVSLKGKLGGGWESIVGYTLDDLKQHLEKQFKAGMSWDNYGKWHIDHRRPVSSFEFKSPDDPEFKECWSLGNLQPLWAAENLAKGRKWAPPKGGFCF